MIENNGWPQARLVVVEKRDMLAAGTTTPQAVDPRALEQYELRPEGHSRVAGREAVAGQMTDDSTSEQGRLGLLSLSPAQWAQLQDTNRRYRERFGIPLIVALRLHGSLESVLDSALTRLQHTPDQEWATALDQVCEVMRGRLQRALAD